MTPPHDNGADWTAADDNAVAAREQAELRVFDAAHKADHWDDEAWHAEYATRRRYGIAVLVLLFVAFVAAGWAVS